MMSCMSGPRIRQIRIAGIQMDTRLSPIRNRRIIPWQRPMIASTVEAWVHRASNSDNVIGAETPGLAAVAIIGHTQVYHEPRRASLSSTSFSI